MSNDLVQVAIRARMGKLRELYRVKLAADELEVKTGQVHAEAQYQAERAQVAFDDYRDDLIGDLFNGCLGQEWLLW